MKFELSSTECEIVYQFERNQTLEDLAVRLGKDISVVSRNIKGIAEKSDVFEKRNGRWMLTEKGFALNKWTEESIYSQRLVLQQQKSVTIASTREFASRILMPKINNLTGDNETTVSIVSSDNGIERLLLSGQADFGFDCGRPTDPLIAFKTVARESFALVASKDYIKKNKIKQKSDLNDAEYLHFTRSSLFILGNDDGSKRTFGTFSDISTLREACKLGHGWTILPYYTVVSELKEGTLKIIPGHKSNHMLFGVWWVRERKSISPWVDKALLWLADQEKSLFYEE
ncbi:MAG: substrate-binding domain-containing protein [Rhizobacter sp.]|nr:substrate-binding domain-containing protein [Bacteriovorax sp.]